MCCKLIFAVTKPIGHVTRVASKFSFYQKTDSKICSVLCNFQQRSLTKKSQKAGYQKVHLVWKKGAAFASNFAKC